MNILQIDNDLGKSDQSLESKEKLKQYIQSIVDGKTQLELEKDFVSNFSFEKNVLLFEIDKVQNFDLNDIFDNGQCFRPTQIQNDFAKSFSTILGENVYIFFQIQEDEKEKENGKEKENQSTKVYIFEFVKDAKFFETKEGKIILDEKILQLSEYLDLDFDYQDQIDKLKEQEEVFAKACEFGQGIRILNQDFFETFISFIISANNNIPRIRKSVNYLAENYGKKIYPYKNIYSFPQIDTLLKLTKEDFKKAGVGFRDVRLVQTIQMLKEKEKEYGSLQNYKNHLIEQDYKKLLEHLNEYSGVGDKVASCIALFSLKQKDFFPIDVWVKRVMQEQFFNNEETKNEIILERVKNWPSKGLAQQYLFYWRRLND